MNIKEIGLAALKRAEKTKVEVIDHSEETAGVIDLFAKLDRVIVNFGSQKEPVYYAGTVQQIYAKRGAVKVLYDDGETHMEPVDNTGLGIIGFMTGKKKFKNAIKPERVLALIDQDRWHVPMIKKLIKGIVSAENKPTADDKATQRIVEQEDVKLNKRPSKKLNVSQELVDAWNRTDALVNQPSSTNSDVLNAIRALLDKTGAVVDQLAKVRKPTSQDQNDLLNAQNTVAFLKPYLNPVKGAIKPDVLAYLTQLSKAKVVNGEATAPYGKVDGDAVIQALVGLNILAYETGIGNYTGATLTPAGQAKLITCLASFSKNDDKAKYSLLASKIKGVSDANYDLLVNILQCIGAPKATSSNVQVGRNGSLVYEVKRSPKMKVNVLSAGDLLKAVGMTDQRANFNTGGSSVGDFSSDLYGLTYSKNGCVVTVTEFTGAGPHITVTIQNEFDNNGKSVTPFLNSVLAEGEATRQAAADAVKKIVKTDSNRNFVAEADDILANFEHVARRWPTDKTKELNSNCEAATEKLENLQEELQSVSNPAPGSDAYVYQALECLDRFDWGMNYGKPQSFHSTIWDDLGKLASLKFSKGHGAATLHAGNIPEVLQLAGSFGVFLFPLVENGAMVGLQISRQGQKKLKQAIATYKPATGN